MPGEAAKKAKKAAYMDLLGRVQERVDAQGHTLLMQRDVRQFVQGHHLWPELQQALFVCSRSNSGK